MPDEKRDVTHFTKYFGLTVPGQGKLTIFLILLGAFSGIIAELILNTPLGLFYVLASGFSLGVTVITFPGILTAFLLKAMKRNLKLKHALIAVIVITITYAAFFIITIFTYNLTHSYAIAYIPILLSDAGIYGYWFIINRIVLNQKKSSVITAAIQPTLNALIFIPVSYSIFAAKVSYLNVLFKLWTGIIVFMICGYIVLFIMDRPSKKLARFSGVDMMSFMIGQWLYGSKNNAISFDKMGIKRDLPVSVLAIKGTKGYKAIFIKPNIHYGPIYGLGGSMATEYLGSRIEHTYKATPFIMHGAVNIEDNPINSSDIGIIWKEVQNKIDSNSKSSGTVGTLQISKSKVDECKAIGIKIGSMVIIGLTKAPYVTEDIDSDIGLYYEALPSKYGLECILIDAHNSRFESANADELKGVYKGSKYVKKYSMAIDQILNKLNKNKNKKLIFGASHIKLKNFIKNNDIGPGYMSVGIFSSKVESFCMIYLDANNMDPKLRSKLLSHIYKKYKLTAELFTTDTHAVNTLAFSASNVIGRYTKYEELVPYIDKAIENAISSKEEVTYLFYKLSLKNFKVWGKGSEELIMNTTRQIIKRGKKIVPFIVVACFVIAAWSIYLV
ncbi:MAG: DUF2070 family protein [Candidatus Micrarchaeia archaeon]